VFGRWSIWIRTSEQVTYQKFAGMDERDTKERGDETNLIASFPFLSSFRYPHTGLFHQGQRPKTVEATVLSRWDFKFSRRRVWCSELSSGIYCCVKSSWWWRQYAPLKRRSAIILHGSTSQKTSLNIILYCLASTLRNTILYSVPLPEERAGIACGAFGTDEIIIPRNNCSTPQLAPPPPVLEVGIHGILLRVPYIQLFGDGSLSVNEAHFIRVVRAKTWGLYCSRSLRRVSRPA
jgi:hypothetical protein